MGLLAWRRRNVPGATAFALVAFSQAWWTLGYLFELTSPGITAKLFWDDLQYVGVILWPLATLYFATVYTKRRIRAGAWWALNLLATASFLVLVATNSLHGLIRSDPFIAAGEPAGELLYSYGPALYLYALYFYGIMFVSVFILATHFRTTTRLYRRQTAVIILGILIPVAGTILSLLEVRIAGIPRDFSPFTFAVSSLIIAWGLFRYRLFDLVPVARDAVMESVPDAVLVVDRQNRLVDANPAAQLLLGRPLDELITSGAPESNVLWQELLRRVERNETEPYRLRIANADSETVFDCRMAPLLDSRGQETGCFILLRDVTRIVQVESALQERSHELEAANRDLLRLSRVKDQFVSNVSHELRTPIQNITLLQTLIARKPERRDAYLGTLARETSRLNDLIENLLTLSKLDLGHAPFRPVLVDLNELVEEFVADRTTLAEQLGLQLAAVLHRPAPVVLADRAQIGQVISIMLTNAMNYTPRGGAIHVRSEVRQGSGEPMVGFSVCDDGPGIREEDFEHLFERFFRGTAGRESSVAGTGLGLAIAQEIVQRHKGSVEVSATGPDGKGATFTVWLPAAAATVNDVGFAEPANAAERATIL